MTTQTHGQPLIIGVGNRQRGDDAAGVVTAEKLKKIGGLDTVTMDGSAWNLIEAWQGQEAVIVVDAVALESRSAGEVVVLDALAENLPGEMFLCSTHSFGLGAAIELSKALGKLPGKLTVIGIVGKQFHMSDGLSREVQQAVDEIVAGWPNIVGEKRHA